MAFELTKPRRDELVRALRRFAAEELEVDMGDLKASLLLDFALERIGPAVYAQAVADAQRHVIERAEEMDAQVRWR